MIFVQEKNSKQKVFFVVEHSIIHIEQFHYYVVVVKVASNSIDEPPAAFSF